RELIEEVMYEKVLSARLKLDKYLAFIAISAASAPLLGLLGTVTGIINTFKLITVFGSGDVKTLSGGISEALITTEFGLIVAIPSLLLHALLSRKSSSIVSEMEKSAVALINQVSKTPFPKVETNGGNGRSKASHPKHSPAKEMEEEPVGVFGADPEPASGVN
ncbi:MAG: MotA/TolQ/ExbB proton channel family protein, partial [Candidatus Omnitrophica bacterium]|nr:MotA/TolQ/ExbB proton channel family protein [Candidatus Omnitrophota bacterium]